MLAAVLISVPGTAIVRPDLGEFFAPGQISGGALLPRRGKVYVFPVSEVRPAPLPPADVMEAHRPRRDRRLERQIERRDADRRRRVEGAWL